MTPAQKHVVEQLLSKIAQLRIYDLWFEHGDCTGSDEEAHLIAQNIGYRIRLHPPTNHRLRAYCVADMVEVVQIYSIRNQNIVRSSDVIIATPAETTPQKRGSGTWQVIRLAQKAKKPLMVVYGDGFLEGHNDWAKVIV